jgi:hypothetical protein
MGEALTEGEWKEGRLRGSSEVTRNNAVNES